MKQLIITLITLVLWLPMTLYSQETTEEDNKLQKELLLDKWWYPTKENEKRLSKQYFHSNGMYMNRSKFQGSWKWLDDSTLYIKQGLKIKYRVEKLTSRELILGGTGEKLYYIHREKPAGRKE